MSLTHFLSYLAVCSVGGPADCRDLQHAFVVVLHCVFLKCVLPVDLVQRLSVVPLLPVDVDSVRVRGLLHGRLGVRVAGEHLRESVAHLQLPVERPREGQAHWVGAAVSYGSAGGGGHAVVLVLAQKSRLVLARRRGGDVPLSDQRGAEVKWLSLVVGGSAQTVSLL